MRRARRRFRRPVAHAWAEPRLHPAIRAAGVPKRLEEEERRKLARYFGIAEVLLGGPAERSRRLPGCSASSAIRCCVSAGPGAVVAEELGQALFRLRRALAEGADAELRRQTCRSSASRAIRWRRRSMPATTSWSISAMRRAAARRHLCAADRRRPGREAPRAQSGRPARHRPVRQSRLSGLARLPA